MSAHPDRRALARERLALPLDVPDESEATRWIRALATDVGVFKIGLELFVSAGPATVARVRDHGARCFLDLKLHDIPETVGRAVRAAAALGVDLLTIHASGGRAMIERAVGEAKSAKRPPRVLAVTVLTSLDDAAVVDVGLGRDAASAATRLGALAVAAGVDGLVCSPQEVAALRLAHPDTLLVTPGIRPSGAALGDQARVATPGQAIRSGAGLLVVGRPIRDAADPAAAARAIVDEIVEAMP